MKHRLSHETREQTGEGLSVSELHSSGEALTFDSPEAMIRHDAALTELPPQLPERIAQSVARESPPKSPTPWWKRWRRS